MHLDKGAYVAQLTISSTAFAEAYNELLITYIRIILFFQLEALFLQAATCCRANSKYAQDPGGQAKSENTEKSLPSYITSLFTLLSESIRANHCCQSSQLVLSKNGAD